MDDIDDIDDINDIICCKYMITMIPGFVPGRAGPENLTKNNAYTIYPLVNVYIAMERSTMFHGKIHYFYGHFQLLC